jgi:NADH-quinone oxidoreductase subunit M
MSAWLATWVLTAVIFAPLIGALVLCLMNVRSHEQIRRGAILASLAALGFSLAALRLFYQSVTDGQPAWKSGQFALEIRVPWLGGAPLLPALDIAYHVGVDGVSIWLLMLTALLTPLAIWASFSGIRERVKEYYVLLLLLETGMLGVFCARDLLLFYVFFEFTLVPLYFIIGIWGGPQRRRAAAMFFIYTIAGSMLTFAGVLFLAYQAYRLPEIARFTFDLDTLYGVGRQLDVSVQRWLFWALAAGFAIKVPLFPLHTWLPLAHTEAPTAGSVLLAGVLLKLGTYGFLRLSLPMLPAATIEMAPIMGGLAIVGIIYGALVAWVQTDVKKLVAYSSVSHLGFCILGMFSLKMAGLTGSLLYMVNHGLSTGALFLVVGMMYERYHTRHVDEIGGLGRRMPWLAFFLVFFTLSSIGLPGLNGFVGEFLVLLGTFSSQTTLDGNAVGPLGVHHAIVAALGIVLGAIYMLWMCERVLFGPLREPPGTPDMSLGPGADLNRREIGILAPIAAACLVIGVWPRPLLDSMQAGLQEQVAMHVAAAMQPDAVAETDTLDVPEDLSGKSVPGDLPIRIGMHREEMAILDGPEHRLPSDAIRPDGRDSAAGSSMNGGSSE